MTFVKGSRTPRRHGLGANMTHAREIEVVDTDHDLVLFDLRQIEVHYREQQARWMRRIEELERQVRESEYRTLTAQKEMAQLQVDLDAQKRQSAEECAHTQQEREHARELASLLKDIHRALFNGNVYDLI